MEDKMTAVLIEPSGGIEACALQARDIAAALYDAGATYDKFLFPYFDSLIMSGAADKFGVPAGTHMLLWDVREVLDRIALPDNAQAFSLDSDHRDIVSFLTGNMYGGEQDAPNDETRAVLGGFEGLLSGPVRPWAIREHARRFCSFTEHIGRMKGVSVKGLTGGCVVASISNRWEDVSEIIESIKIIYNGKTGGICKLFYSK